MRKCFYLAAALLVFIPARIQADTRENSDFLRGNAYYQDGKGSVTGFPEAIEAFRLAAEQGDARAQFYLGRMHYFGQGVPVNLKLAERWYTSAGEKGESAAWNNLANMYGEQGKPEEIIIKTFARASDLGNALGSFNFARVLHAGFYGVQKDFTRALAYYHKALAQQAHYPRAWEFIGRLYEEGGPGVPRDLKAAETAYLNGARDPADKDCYHYLHTLSKRGNRLPGETPAFHELEKQAEGGDHHVAQRIADCYATRWNGEDSDPIKAAYFWDLAAKQGAGRGSYYLFTRAKDDVLVAHYGKEAAQRWIDRWKSLDKTMRNLVSDELPMIRKVFESGDESAAADMLEQSYKRWISHTPDRFGSSCYGEVWREAQIGGGRADLEWGRFLSTWLTRLFEADIESGNVLVARINLNGCLSDLGRFGLLRNSIMESKRLIRELEGVDVDAVLAAVSISPEFAVVGAENFPLRGNKKEAERSQRIPYDEGVSSGDMIGGQAMGLIKVIADEHLLVGDWKSALALSEWIKRWSDKLTFEKKKPLRDYPGCLDELQRRCHELKANVFAALGLQELEAAAYQNIIEMGFDQQVYGGRDFHKAHYMLAKIDLNQGQAGKVDLAAIKDVEDRIRVNRYVRDHAWQYAKLVRAGVLAEVQGAEEARPLVSEVLAWASKDQLPRLRLEALLTLVEIELKVGNTNDVLQHLEEALSWARSEGLLLIELRTVELYVTCLIKMGDYDQSLAMQHRVLELIDALKLTPRRQRAVLRLAEIQGLRRDHTTARALLKEMTSPSLVDGARAIGETLKLTEASEPATKPVTLEQVTLQPMGIQSMPLRQQAEAIFILSNPNPGANAVELTAESEAFGLVLKQNSNSEVEISCSPSQDVASPRLLVNVVVPGTGQLPITLSAEGFSALEHDVKVSLQAIASSCAVVQKSEWLIHAKGSEVAVAVIDAAQLKNSAFCLVPVYHHLDSLDEGKKSASFRVVASEPTRVEGYASDGTLLFVDAQGNGSFSDAGDLIATAVLDDLFPVLNADSANGRIALRYQPFSRDSTRRVELSIQSRVHGESGDWTVDAIDWLER
jgi:Sel1 repeat